MKKVKASIKKAMKHKDELGEGAKKRRGLSKEDKITTVMKEWKRKTLFSGNGKKVVSQKQAIAIALSEARNRKKK